LNVKNYNAGFAYLFGVKDQFSKYVWLFPLKDKTPKGVYNALKKLFQSYKCKAIVMDNGGEMKNNLVLALLKEQNIKPIFIPAYTPTSNSSIEIFWKYFKSTLFKYRTLHQTKSWINVYKLILEKYNNTKHTSLGNKYTPKQVLEDPTLWEEVREFQKPEWDNKKGKTYPEIKRGDWVRVSIYENAEQRKKAKFKKGYTPNFTLQVYKCIKVLPNSKKYKIRNKDTKEVKTLKREMLLKIPKNTTFLDQERINLKPIKEKYYDRERGLREINARPRAPKQVVKVKSFLEERKSEPKRKRSTPKKYDDFV
jgi:hypothetical protein